VRFGLQFRVLAADDEGMEPSAELANLVGRLCAIAAMPDAPAIVVARFEPGAEPEVRIPPPGLASSSDELVEKIVGGLACGLSSETTLLGVAFPAVTTGWRVEACTPAQADGHAVCVAGRIDDGVGSVGVFRSAGGDRWNEAHAALDWLCEPLRLLVGDGPLDADESSRFTVGG
jgi:hypothetical protein